MKNIYMATKIYILLYIFWLPYIYFWLPYIYFWLPYIYFWLPYIYFWLLYIYFWLPYIYFLVAVHIFLVAVYIFLVAVHIFLVAVHIFLVCRIYFWLTYIYFLLPYIYSCTILSHLAPHIVLTRVSTRFVPGKQGSGPSQPRICVLICSWSAVLHSCLFDSATIFAGEWELEEQ